jgi:hypothetical protein
MYENCIIYKYIIVILILTIIIMWMQKPIEKFSSGTINVESLENLASMYQNGTLKVTNIEATGNIKSVGDIQTSGQIFAKKNIETDGDLIFNGDNKWIIHSPNDGRTVMHIAPATSNKANWDWGKGMSLDKGTLTIPVSATIPNLTTSNLTTSNLTTSELTTKNSTTTNLATIRKIKPQNTSTTHWHRDCMGLTALKHGVSDGETLLMDVKESGNGELVFITKLPNNHVSYIGGRGTGVGGYANNHGCLPDVRSS